MELYFNICELSVISYDIFLQNHVCEKLHIHKSTKEIPRLVTLQIIYTYTSLIYLSYICIVILYASDISQL